MSDALARDARLCRNFLSILRSLDQHELVAAGVFGEDDLPDEWTRFMSDPFRTYLSFDGDQAQRCFAAVQRQLPEELQSIHAEVR